MRKILIKAGKDFLSNKLSIVFFNETHNLVVHLDEDFQKTKPYAGKVLDEDEIKEMIDFLLKTLEEREEHEQSDLE